MMMRVGAGMRAAMGTATQTTVCRIAGLALVHAFASVVGALVVCALVVCALVVCGCEPTTAGKIHETIDAPAPRHPAMSRGSVSASASISGAHPALPSGHPPVGRDPGFAAGNQLGGAATANQSGGATLPAEGRISVGRITFAIPKGMVRERPTVRMRAEQIRLPRAQGDAEDGLLTLIIAGGSIQQNIDRWSGQFVERPEPRIATVSAQNVEVTTVRLEGTFKCMGGPFAGGGGASKAGVRLWGAIVSTPDSGTVFFKATGPSATLQKWDAALDEMARGIRVE